MHTGQTLLVIFGIVLLSVLGISVNRTTLQGRVTIQRSSLIASAVATAERYIEEAEKLRFDEDNTATIPSSFTTPNQLGPDSGENYPNFDDIDDFDSLSIADSTSAHAPFAVNISVDYVNKLSLDTPISTRTYYKKMSVSVSSPYFNVLPAGAVTVTRIFAYHYFWSDQWE